MTENKYDNGQTFFDLVICDFDSALFRAAQYVEETYLVVKHKRSGKEMTFKNRTEFWGRKKNTIEGEVGKWSEFFGLAIDRDEFELTEHVKIKDEFSVDPVGEAFKHFNQSVGKIKNAHLATDYKLVIGGKGNYRFEAAKVQPYKGHRKEKPIVFYELREKIIAQYGDRIEIADNREAEDILGWYGTENFQEFNKTGKWKYLLSYIDKDLLQIVSPYINYDHLKNGITFITPEAALHRFCLQLIIGDKAVDNILGLPDLHPLTREMYGLRNGSGCGEAAANGILETAKTPLEMMLRVADAYKKFYGADTVHVLSCGTEYRWKDFLRETGILIRMEKFKDENYDIIDVLEIKMKQDLDALNLVLEIDPETKEKKIVNRPIEAKV